MVGATGPRMLAATLAHVDAWNTWYVECGNTPEGFAALSRGSTRRPGGAGRDPAEIERSVCVLVVLDRDGRRAPARRAAARGPPAQIAAGLRAFAAAGADEAIVVVDPITEASIRALGEALWPGRSSGCMPPFIPGSVARGG